MSLPRLAALLACSTLAAACTASDGAQGPAGPSGPSGPPGPTYGGADFTLSDQDCPAGSVALGVDASGVLRCGTAPIAQALSCSGCVGDLEIATLSATKLTGTLAEATLPASVPLLQGGQLPESVLPASVPLLGGDGKIPQAVMPAVQLVAVDLPCDAARAGMLRWDAAGKRFEGCDGTSWITFAAAPTGQGAQSAALSCAAILFGGYSAGDGVYWIDPDGPGGVGPFQAWCDMTADGGGWTLWASVALGATQTAAPVVPSSNAYLDPARFAALLSASGGFEASGIAMFRAWAPATGAAFYVSASEAASAGCHGLLTSVPEAASASYPLVYGHEEATGCDISGLDFAFLGVHAGGHVHVGSSGGVALWHVGSPSGSTDLGGGAPMELLDTAVQLYVR